MSYSLRFNVFLFIGIICTYKSISIYINKKSNLIIDLSKNRSQSIISSRNKKSYCASCASNEELFIINNNEFLKDKKLITISPGGFKGFYLLGILAYLKENYNTDNLIFSGASAGAWNSLFMSYKGDTMRFVYNFLDENIRKANSLTELQYFLKYKLISTYKTDDFDLKRIFIGVTTINKLKLNTNIYTDFDDLEDAINCCMASSHIPLITGGLTNRYKNIFSLDGGFSDYPYLDKDKLLHISLSLWDELKGINSSKHFLKIKMLTIKNFSDFFSLSKNNLLELFDDGYQDAKIHKDYLDNIFEKKYDEPLEF
jgi:hypothetical protein